MPKYQIIIGHRLYIYLWCQYDHIEKPAIDLLFSPLNLNHKITVTLHLLSIPNGIQQKWRP